MAVETYISQQKNQLLDSLENQVRFSQLVAVVIGEKGIGKSFLINQLQRRLKNDVLAAKIDASLAMTEDQLEKTISLQLGLSWQESDSNLEQRIQNDLAQKVFITIDDAHLLSSSCLDYILQLNQNQLHLQESVLFILLTGDASLPGMINETNTFSQHQEMCVVFQIETIQQSETKSLVANFANIDNDQLDEFYDEKKLHYFWQLSKGNPAELNYHLSRWLEENAPVEIIEVIKEEKASYVKSAFYVLIVIALSSMLIFQDKVNSLFASDPEEVAQPNNDVNPLAADKLSDEEESLTKGQINRKKPVKDPLESSENQEPKIPEDNGQESDSKKNELNPSSNAQTTNPEIKIEQEKDSQNAKSSDGKEKLANPTPKDPANLQTTAINSGNGSRLTVDETFLLNQNSKLFVLQWVGLSQQQAVEIYKNQHPLKNKILVYRRAKGKQVLYLAISDQFLNRLQADNAKAEYKKRGYQGTPWVKSMDAVQQELRGFQDANIN